MDTVEMSPTDCQQKPPVPRPPQPVVCWILGVSLFLGIIGNGLLRAIPLGINGPLFVGLLSLCLIWGWQHHEEQAPCRSLLAVAFLLSLCLTFRDAPVLRGLDIATIVMLMIVLGARPQYSDLHGDALSSLLVNVFRGVGRALKAPFLLLFQETDWSYLFKGDTKHNIRSIARGLALLIPTLLLFLWLFSMADAVFRHMIETFLDNISDICRRLSLHVFWTLLFFVMVTQFLRPMILGKKWERFHITPAKEWVPGQIELFMVMGSVLALFLVFIVIQFRYLFGGHDLIRTIPGLTYATYARKGFFALLFIVLLVHIILLLGAWLVAGTDLRVQSLYRGLSLGLITLTTFVFISAYYRLCLYVEAYGLTQSRLYAAAVLLWLAVIFVILTIKMIKPQWRCFTGAYVYSLLTVLLLLNVANPDGLIARINLQRSITGKDLDRDYLKCLSTDAVPTILRYQTTLPNEKCNSLARHIVTRRISITDDWRSWSYSRANARKLLDQ